LSEITFHSLGAPQVTQVTVDELPANAQDAKFYVGEIVYEPYAPRKYGKILQVGWSIDMRYSGRPFYLVRWKDGREEWVWELHLNSLEVLVADHEKKINTHRKNIEKAKKL
jgi:hypothetical protein